MNYLDSGLCDNYWFDSATPTFAIKLIERNNFFIPELETGIEVGDEIKTSSDVDQLPLTTLLFQTGYLTIDSFDSDQGIYFLKYPNEEVRRSLTKHLFLFFTKKGDTESRKIITEHRKGVLNKEDFESFFILCECTFSRNTLHQSHCPRGVLPIDDLPYASNA